MNRKEYLAEMRKRINSVEEGHSDCRGTRAYLSQVKDRDSPNYFKPYFLRKKFELLEKHCRTDIPEVGDIAAWVTPVLIPMHEGIVVNTNPLQIAHRNGWDGEFHKNQNVSELYTNEKTELRYYVPPILKNSERNKKNE